MQHIVRNHWSQQAIVRAKWCCLWACWGAWTVLASSAAVAFAEVAQQTRPEQPAAAASADAEDERQWMRIDFDRNRTPIALQTSIVRYQGKRPNGDKLTVDLIGAVHVGDKAYYQALNQRFTEYDALLYELVAPPGARVEKGRGTSNRHPVGALQNGMKLFLGLEHQLELVDYTPQNFVHADMSPDEFSESMKRRGEGLLQMMFRMMGHGVALQSRQQARGESSDAEILVALFSNDRALLLKRAVARQLQDAESILAAFGGPQGSTIITERNKVAIAVLQQEIERGRRRIGIFYGAGHMPDFDRRFREELNLVPQRREWLTAWDMDSR